MDYNWDDCAQGFLNSPEVFCSDFQPEPEMVFSGSQVDVTAEMMEELMAAVDGPWCTNVLEEEAGGAGVPTAAGGSAFTAEEASRCGGRDEESRLSYRADNFDIPPWTLIVPKVEENSNFLQLPNDQVVGVRLPADIDSVSASTAHVLVPVLGGIMSHLKKKLGEKDTEYDEEKHDKEDTVDNQHEIRQEGRKQIKSFNKEDAIVPTDDCGKHLYNDEEEKNVREHGIVYPQKLHSVLMKMRLDNDITYSLLIDGYARKGESDEVLKLYYEMESRSLSPGLLVYTSLIKSSWQCGKLEEANKYFRILKDRSLVPSLSTYETFLANLSEQGNTEKG